MSKNTEKTMDELFEELKKDLTFLPDVDDIKEAYLFAFKFVLVM